MGKGRPEGKFQLLRYFSIASGIALLVMTLVVVWAYYKEEVADEVQSAEERNSMLAQTFSNVIWPQFGGYLAREDGFKTAPAETRRLRATLAVMAKRVPVTKIKIYHPSGIAVYSSDDDEIGEDRASNPLFVAALRGKPVSEFTMRGERSPSEDEIETSDVVSSYIPIADDAGRVQAVFELYSDVSDAVGRIRHDALRLLLGLIALFAALYGVLLLIVANADTILQRQYRELKENEAKIQAANLALRESEEAAASASRAKTEFLSSMSHELRTPMNAILGFGQLLLSEPGAPLGAQRARFVEQILKAGRHLLELINEVLDLARIEAGKLVLSVEPVSVYGVMRECVPLVQNLAHERGVKVEAGAAEADGYVMADYMRLKQSLLNLLSNAIKYNHRGGSVSVRVRPAGERVRISVADTGPGIPAARQAEIFRPFHRLAHNAAEVEGTGIGLALTRNFVAAMGGDIGFDSELGRGTTFWIELARAREPLAAAAGPAPALEAQPAAGPAAAPTLLYIEDNPANVLLMAEIARRMSLGFLTAHNAELGIDLARTRRPDVIVMDINLPQMSGYEALVQLKQHAATAAIPVMALSANAMEKDVARGLAAGFVRYHTKPIDVEQMVASIRQVLERK
ncbi:MAG TPA: ATP-binding protein [Burkholderiales bacterium]|jgi:signal transduction histidine kinase/CheY-like chemotaxis protein|nr:ATP-binding protein [Burkholderiales bacterium]